MNSYSIPRKLPFSKKTLPKKIVFSYVLDYVIIILLFIAFWALDAVEPFHQHFSLSNYNLQYPYAVHERVPVPLLFFLAVVCPAGIIAVYTLVIDGVFSRHTQAGASQGKRWKSTYRFKDRLWELNCGILGLLLASGTAFVITGALKNATGKPRPDFIDRCQPPPGSTDPPLFGLSSSTICTQTALLKDGFRSFPSGHSSTAFGGLFYLSLYLSGKLHVLDNRGEVWKTYIVLIPTLSAALIAISRIMDARHHPFDVITGSLLGTLTAFCAYRQYFPPVSESWRKGRAYPIRSWGTAPLDPTAAHVEREMARDRGVEPLRAGANHGDEGQLPIQYSVEVSNPSPSLNPDQNVFRQQLAQSERLRQHEFELTSAAANYQPSLGLQNPTDLFPASEGQRGRPLHTDDNWSSSSSEHDNGHDEYELQPRYTLSDSHPALQQSEFTATRLPVFSSHTAYDPQIYSSGPTAGALQPPPRPTSGSLSGTVGNLEEHLGHEI